MTAKICQFLSRVDHGWKSLEIVGLFQRQRIFFSWVTPGEDIKLKVADVVVAREVDRRLERHRLQTGGYRVHLRVLKITWACHRIICQQHLSWALQSPRKDHLVERESKHLPRNDGPLPKGGSPEIGGITASVVDGNQLQCWAHLLVILKLSPAKTPWGNTALSSLSI